MQRSAVSLLLAQLVFLLPGPASGQASLPDSAYYGKVIRSVNYRADSPLDRSHYDLYLPLKPGDTLTRSGVKSAIQALYEMGRFSQVAVSAAAAEDGDKLEFQLLLNYYFNDFQVAGDIDLGERSPTEVIPLPVGERFSDDRLEEAREAVL